MSYDMSCCGKQVLLKKVRARRQRSNDPDTNQRSQNRGRKVPQSDCAARSEARHLRNSHQSLTARPRPLLHPGALLLQAGRGGGRFLQEDQGTGRATEARIRRSMLPEASIFCLRSMILLLLVLLLDESAESRARAGARARVRARRETKYVILFL